MPKSRSEAGFRYIRGKVVKVLAKSTSKRHIFSKQKMQHILHLSTATVADTSPNPKILLFGSGAIRAIYVYLLLKAGCDTAAKSDGFHIDSEVFGKGIHITPKVVRTVSEATESGPYDYLIVSCKAIPSAKTPP
ncbi:hypothetical protein AC579_8958 [Pseudocercospora musae]|uniref:Ketopantoate reductase N-terminal domain-containing protein n=1 Tax=Pseudocercospora musae TaxID=113226 RepID=A0A139I515_9PEZI|nr:hypothetical protein AC579_8958 [Pseudocercospora musae]